MRLQRLSSAEALAASSVIAITKTETVALLRNNPAFSKRFLPHMLKRNLRIESDLAAALFDDVEHRAGC